jgi:hypothetical protein
MPQRLEQRHGGEMYMLNTKLAHAALGLIVVLLLYACSNLDESPNAGSTTDEVSANPAPVASDHVRP